MVLEEILAFKDLGIGVIAVVIFYSFAVRVTDNAAKQLTQLQNQFLNAYKENTKALESLVAEFKEHIRCKDAALRLLEEKYRKG